MMIVAVQQYMVMKTKINCDLLLVVFGPLYFYFKFLIKE